MKTLRSIGMAFTALLLSLSFSACNDESEVINENSQDEKYITVGLGCTGEFLEISNSPMSRSTTDVELYGIQVYSLLEREGGAAAKVFSRGNYTYYEEIPYAYGIFKSLDDVKIRLLEGQEYRFKVSIVIDPYKEGERYWFNYDSFEYSNTKGSEFTYSTSNILGNLTYTYNLYNYDRFYGELDKYTPETNTDVSIDTKRVTYGVNFIAEGLTEGTMTIEVRDRYTVSLTAINPQHEGIYVFESIYSAWKGISQFTGTYDPETGDAIYEYTNYTCDKDLTISWTKADGTVLPLGTYTVNFKRNVKTTIKIQAEDLNIATGIKVYKEEVSMVPDENIYEITGGTITEVPVTSGN